MTVSKIAHPPAGDRAAPRGGPRSNGQPRMRTVVAAGMPRTAKVIRIGVMANELLEEVHRAPLDEAGRARLRDILNASVGELTGCLPDRLAAELGRLAPPLSGSVPSQAELRVAQAQLAGWLEGLLQSVQVSMEAQQAAALRQLAEQPTSGQQPNGAGPAHPERADAYL